MSDRPRVLPAEHCEVLSTLHVHAYYRKHGFE